MKYLVKLQLTLLILAFPIQVLFGTIVHAEKKVRRFSTEAVIVGNLGLPNEKSKLNFNFGQAEAWLNTDGDWAIQGTVKHGHLLCASYQMGIRFGAGAPGCTNVKWVSKTRYVTFRKQCNQARLNHRGGDSNPALASDFERITCAQQVISCSGRC